MKNFLTDYFTDSMFSLPMAKPIVCVFFVAAVTFFFSVALSVAMLFFIFLFCLTLAALLKLKVAKKELLALLVIGLLVHMGIAFLISIPGVNLVGGGADYESYHMMAREIAQRASVGSFSLHGVRGGHDFTLLVGAAYSLFYPDILIGKVLILWFFCLSLIFSYLIIVEMGGSAKIAFWTGILISLYPSYLFFGNLLLKDTIVTPLVLLALLVCLKMLREFSWVKFLLFFIILVGIIHLRFYIGYSLMFSFLVSWFLVANFKRKMLYGLYIFFLLGFAPYVLGSGYYGVDVLREFINPDRITIYREIAYNPGSPNNENVDPILPGQPIPVKKNQNDIPLSQNLPPQSAPIVAENQNTNLPAASPPIESVPSGFGSSFVVETGLKNGAGAFVKNSIASFGYGLLGPFPWQLRYKRQYVALFETIPWYLIWAFFLYSFLTCVKERNIIRLANEKKFSILLIIFAVLAMGGLSLFINNYGIIVRIRIPIVISLLIAGCVVFNNYLEKLPWLKNI